MNALWALLVFGFTAFALLYVAYLYVTADFGDLFGGPYQPRSNWPPYPPDDTPPAEPLEPKVLRDFGAHHNPLSLSGKECSAEFWQVDARTWECLECKLVRFEKS